MGISKAERQLVTAIQGLAVYGNITEVSDVIASTVDVLIKVGGDDITKSGYLKDVKKAIDEKNLQGIASIGNLYLDDTVHISKEEWKNKDNLRILLRDVLTLHKSSLVGLVDYMSSEDTLKWHLSLNGTTVRMKLKEHGRVYDKGLHYMTQRKLYNKITIIQSIIDILYSLSVTVGDKLYYSNIGLAVDDIQKGAYIPQLTNILVDMDKDINKKMYYIGEIKIPINDIIRDENQEEKLNGDAYWLYVHDISKYDSTQISSLKKHCENARKLLVNIDYNSTTDVIKVNKKLI